MLLVQYHSLDTIIRLGQWNALRHGHYAYYSTTALLHMLAAEGFAPARAWTFELYGGTVLLAARREADGPVAANDSVPALLAADARAGVRDPVAVATLQDQVLARAEAVRNWLLSERQAGHRVRWIRRRRERWRAP